MYDSLYLKNNLSFLEFISSNLYYIIIIIFVLVYIIRYINKKRKNAIISNKLSITSMTDDFRRRYIELYNTNISQLELERKKILFTYISCIVILILSFLISIISQSIFALYIGSAIVLIIFFISIKSISNYSKLFKNNIIASLLRTINDKLTYKPSSGIEPNIYKSSQFENSMFNIYKYDDYISGYIDENTKINLCDLQVKLETGSGKNRNVKELFTGLFGYFECSKNINTVIKIKRNSIKFFKNNSAVNMDSSIFEKYFDVYSHNKIITMQMLTPEVMELVLDFYSKYDIEFEISIIDNIVYFRFFTGKMFETKIFKNSMDRELLWGYYTIINFVLEFSKKVNSIVNDLEI